MKGRNIGVFAALFCLWMGQAELLPAEDLSFGLPAFEKNLNYFHDAGPAAFLVRNAVVKSLVSAGSEWPNGFRLRLADSALRGVGKADWSFRLKRDQLFTNGRLISIDDVLYSLDRCRKEGTLTEARNLSSRLDSYGQSWVDLKLGETSESAIAALPQRIAACPIIERAASQVFAEDLGLGTNIVGSGEFRVQGFVPGQEIVLMKAGEGSGKKVTLRGFRDSRSGLTALRTGTIDALFSPDDETAGIAKKDETLRLAECSIYRVVLRKGLEFECSPEVNLAGVRYRF